MDSEAPQHALHEAMRIAGSQVQLAVRLGIRQQSVSKWLQAGRPPAERVLDIERATGGQVTRHQLRPDLYPPATADGAQDAPVGTDQEVTEATG